MISESNRPRVEALARLFEQRAEIERRIEQLMLGERPSVDEIVDRVLDGAVKEVRASMSKKSGGGALKEKPPKKGKGFPCCGSKIFRHKKTCPVSPGKAKTDDEAEPAAEQVTARKCDECAHVFTGEPDDFGTYQCPECKGYISRPTNESPS